MAGMVHGGPAAKLAVSANKFFDDVKIGDSIAVNGVCLTVTHTRKNFAEFDLSAETVKRSTLGEIKISDRVNLEKALLLQGRLGGHIVTGHIDGVADVKNKTGKGEGFDLYLSVPSELIHYLVNKASIAVDGVSLTLADFRDGLVKISVIPHSAKHSTLGLLGIGDKVNIEIDLLSKYIEKHLRQEPKGITDETMVRVGFLPMGWIDN